LHFFDLWEYVERKLASSETLIAHPRGNVQHPSASATNPMQACLAMQMANEVDSITNLSECLESLIDSQSAPAKVRQQAQLYQKLLELRPLQQIMRQRVLKDFT
jgi:hypothetical protein